MKKLSVVFITSIDDTLEELSSVSRNTQSNKYVNDFSKSLEQFSRYIFSINSDAPHSDNKSDVVILAFTKSCGNIPGLIRLIFDFSVNLDDEINTEPKLKIPPLSDKQITASAKRLLEKLLRYNSMTVTNNREFSNLIRMKLLVKKYQSKWFEEVGFPLKHSYTKSSDNTVITINSSDISKLSDMTMWRTNSKSSGYQKVDTNIDPVHWSDIGGLERSANFII
jgi:hypothetical protein